MGVDAISCARCGGDTVHDAAYCHRCGASLASRPARPHVRIAVAAVLVAAAALAWALVPSLPGIATEAEPSALLLGAAEAPEGTSVGALPARYADALGVATNPAPLPEDAVAGFTEGFGFRPDEAWVEFVAVPSAGDAGVLLFSFWWADAEEAGASARGFVGSAGCSDVDVALAGAKHVVALVAIGGDGTALAHALTAVADVLRSKAPDLRDACTAPPPVPDAPQIRLEDAPGDDLARGRPLAVLLHEGGPVVDWEEASLRLARDSAPTVAVAFSVTGDCEDATLAPAGTFAPGDALVLCAADDRWETGARLRARVVLRSDGAEVWAGDVVVR